jgi:hypothetical protein
MHGADLHAVLTWRNQFGVETTIGSADTNATEMDGGSPDSIDVHFQHAAIPAACGDLLILRTKVVSANSNLWELWTLLTLP